MGRESSVSKSDVVCGESVDGIRDNNALVSELVLWDGSDEVSGGRGNVADGEDCVVVWSGLSGRWVILGRAGTGADCSGLVDGLA